MSPKSDRIRAFARVVFMVAALLFAASPAWAYLPPKFGGKLTVAMPSRVYRFDPSLATQDHELMIAACLFDTLVAPGPGGGFVPVLLTVLPEKSDDGKTYYFKLREGIAFHDGTPLDAADVLQTFKRLAKNRRSPYRWLLRNVEGVSEFTSNKSGTISGLKITDPLSFEIKLTEPDQNFMKYLCFPALSIISSTAGRDLNPPVGTGPFKFAEAAKNGVITLGANEDYFAGRPYLDSVDFRPLPDERDRMTEFRRGTVDLTAAPEAGLSRAEDDMFGPAMQSPASRIYFLDVNTSAAAFFLPGQRQALSHAVDRDGIVRVILNGNGSKENNVTGAGDARALRKSAENSKRMALRYPEKNTALGLIAKKLQQDFKKAGVALKLEPKTAASLTDYSSEESPAMILRSLPELMGMPESVEDALFASGASSAAAMDRRLGVAHTNKTGVPIGAYIKVFSLRRGYIARESVSGLYFDGFGVPSLESAYVREFPDKKETRKDADKDGGDAKTKKKTEKEKKKGD